MPHRWDITTTGDHSKIGPTGYTRQLKVFPYFFPTIFGSVYYDPPQQCFTLFFDKPRTPWEAFFVWLPFRFFQQGRAVELLQVNKPQEVLGVQSVPLYLGMHRRDDALHGRPRLITTAGGCPRFVHCRLLPGAFPKTTFNSA